MSITAADVVAAWDAVALTDLRSAAIHPSGWDAAAYDASGKQAAAELREQARRHCKATPRTWLDWGCGDGRVLRHLGKSATGYDPAPAMAAAARAAGCTATSSVGDLGQYAVVYCLAVLIHQEPADGVEMIHAMWEHVAPGGLLVLDLPVYEQGRRRLDWTDVTVWSVAQWRALLAELDVEVLAESINPGAFDFAAPGPQRHTLRRPK